MCFPVFPKEASVFRAALLLHVLPGQLAVEVKCSLLLPALEEGGSDFPAQAPCVGFQKHGGVDDAEEQPHDKQHRGAGGQRGADAAAGRAEGQVVVVTLLKVPQGRSFVRKLKQTREKGKELYFSLE